MKFKKIILLACFVVGVLANNFSFAENVQVFIRHEVVDYKVWKKGYDAFTTEQRKGGVYFQKVYQAIDNPNDVTVIHDFHSLEKAKAFMDNEKLFKYMKEIGVKSKPEIWYVRLDNSSK
jgi:hypothetical protein